MGKKHRHVQVTNTNKEMIMSTNTQPESTESTGNQSNEASQADTTASIPNEQVNMDALKTKPQDETPKAEKKEEEQGVFSTFIIEPIKKVWNGTAVPLWAAGKTLVLDGIDAVKNGFSELQRQYESQGFMRFSLSKLGKAATTLAKVGIVVTVAALLNNYLMANFGFSILSVNAILISLGVALVAYAIVSYMNQKELTKDFTFAQIGSDVAYAMVA